MFEMTMLFEPVHPIVEDPQLIQRWLMDEWDSDFARATGKLPPFSRLTKPKQPIGPPNKKVPPG